MCEGSERYPKTSLDIDRTREWVHTLRRNGVTNRNRPSREGSVGSTPTHGILAMRRLALKNGHCYVVGLSVTVGVTKVTLYKNGNEVVKRGTSKDTVQRRRFN